MLYFLKF